MTDEELLDALCKDRLIRRGYVIRTRVESDKDDAVGGILRRTAEHYGIRIADILSRKRSGSIARARQVAMYLARKDTQLTFKEIGDIFGRDHGTVIWAVQAIEHLATQREMQNTLAALTLDNHNGLR